MRRLTMDRAAAAVISGAMLLALVAGPSGDLWRASDAGNASDASDASEGFLPGGDAGGAVPDPAAPAPLTSCAWTRAPLPDSAIEIPNPEDYLIPLEDGAFLLPDEEVEVNGHRISLALLQDLMWIATDQGVSVEEAIFRYGWQEQFGQITEQLRGAHPGEVADARIVNDGCAARIAFKAAVPPLAVTLTESLPVPVELIGDRGYHEEELVEVLHAVYHPIVGHPDVANAGGGPHAETGVVTIYAQPREDTTRADRVALCRALRPGAPANPAITIQLILVDDINAQRRRLHAC